MAMSSFSTIQLAAVSKTAELTHVRLRQTLNFFVSWRLVSISSLLCTVVLILCIYYDYPSCGRRTKEAATLETADPIYLVFVNKYPWCKAQRSLGVDIK